MSAYAERWVAVVADAMEAELRHRIQAGLLSAYQFDALQLRAAVEASARRARYDLEDIELSVREIREAADA